MRFFFLFLPFILIFNAEEVPLKDGDRCNSQTNVSLEISRGLEIILQALLLLV